MDSLKGLREQKVNIHTVFIAFQQRHNNSVPVNVNGFFFIYELVTNIQVQFSMNHK